MGLITEKIPFIKYLADFLQSKEIPKHKFTFFYLLGGISLFLFVVQLVSGVLLSLYYMPHPDHAYESVMRIMTDVDYGWLVRSVHSWGANLMVAFVLLHMFSVFFMKAYRRPREFMWFSGAILFFLVLGFAFTGYLLPWDVVAYYATQIGTEIPKSIPVIGEITIQILRGEGEVGSEALKRMYAIHVIILPLLTLLLVSFHLILQQVLGSSTPIGITPQGQMRFLPNFIYRDLLSWTVISAALMFLATMLPVSLSEKADPLASAPLGIKPEWYFLPLYQTLRIFPSTVFSLNGEMLVNLLVVFGATFWLLVPILDRKANREENNPLFTLIGISVILYCALMITAAYLT
jgi:cytochrome b6